MHHRVILDGIFKISFLLGVRQFAVFQQIGDFEEVTLFGKLLDRIAAIQKLTYITINKGDL